MADFTFEPLTVRDLDEVTITPEECSTQGGEQLVITFPRTLPNDPILIFLHGSVITHKLEATRDNECTISITLPAHKPAEMVDISVYLIPTPPSEDLPDHTYQPHLLLEDKILYTDMSSYLAELLVQSVTDTTQAFYSMLPPLASLNDTTLQEFDHQLSDALQDVELPNNWTLMSSEAEAALEDTLLHFAARSRLVQLFSILLSMPGGRQAVRLKNKDGKTPLDLARESNCREIISAIGKIIPISQSNETMSSHSDIQLMKDIDSNWIQMQRQKTTEGNVLSLLRTPTPHQLNIPTITYLRRSSIAVMEQDVLKGNPVTSSVSDFLLHECLGRSWSRVVGNRRSRSVGTGLNELHRLTEAETALELQELRHQQLLNNDTNKEAWLGGWSISCPVLYDDAVSDLVHSTVTDPGTFVKSAFSSDFTPPTSSDDANIASCDTASLPDVVGVPGFPIGVPTVPSVLIENDSPPTNRKDSKQQSEDNFLLDLADLADSSEEDYEDEERRRPSSPSLQYPLSSKSAPSFSNQSAMATPETSSSNDTLLDEPTPKNSKSHSISAQGEPEPKPHHLLEAETIKVQTTPSTPVGTPPSQKRSHRKSHSISGIAYVNQSSNSVEEDDKDEATSSFVSTSSKQDTTSSSDNESLEDNIEPVHTNLPTVSSPDRSYLTELVKQENIDNSHSDNDDITDGDKESTLKGRHGRRYSVNIITNVDEYNASSDDEYNTLGKIKKSQSFHETLVFMDTSTADQTEATPTHTIETAPTKDHEEENEKVIEEMTAKEDEIEVELNTSQSAVALSNVPPPTELPLVLPSTSSHAQLTKSSTLPVTTPTINVKHTIHLLKALTQMENNAIKIQSPSSEPTLQSAPLTPPVEYSPRPHTKVFRNSSSVSDHGVIYQAPPTKDDYMGGSSSLDFSPEGRSSPRHRFFPVQEGGASHIPFPLKISKSPRNSPQPGETSTETTPTNPAPLLHTHKMLRQSSLEKKARSVDNLLSEHEKPHTKDMTSDENISKPNVRFNMDTDNEVQQQHKNIQMYLGIESAEIAKEQHKTKGISKLFRRDSKKDKRTKKTDSISSLDSFSGNHDDKGWASGRDKTKNVPPIYQSMQSQPSSRTPPPSARKPRSRTIHGDMNLMVEYDETKSKDENKKDQEDSLSPQPQSPSEVTILSNESDIIDDSALLSFTDHEQTLLATAEESDTSWYRTIDRRLRRSINKHEKGRQGAIFDWIRTERHIYRSVLILKLFRDKMKSELNMADDVLDQLFPGLYQLLEVSKDFSTKLEKRQRQSSMMVEDISDILLERFTGDLGEQMREAYTCFVCRQSEALEIFRDHERRRQKFTRLMNGLYQHKICERRKLADFFLLITQRVSKYVEMMKKLLKETEILKLDHLERLKRSSQALEVLVQSVDKGVEDYENRKTLEGIQTKLEVHIPRNLKHFSKLKNLKMLDFTAQNRHLLKTGEGHWLGGGKSIAVHIVLVTDLIALLSERDQKYHLASLQDYYPPVIRLFDLHVRLDGSVRSGTQLLLLKQGEIPEMFRIEFSSKKEAKIWQEVVNKAVEHCKENDLRCEHFGNEPVTSGDEGKDDEEEAEDTFVELSPNAMRRMMVQHALLQANHVLSTAGNITADTQTPSARHSIAAPATVKNNQTYHTPTQSLVNQRKAMRSTTMYTTRACSMDSNVAEAKRKKKLPERGQSFLDKKGSSTDENSHDKEKQVYLECIANLKEAVEALLQIHDEDTLEIAKLRENIQSIQIERRRQSEFTRSSPILPRSSIGSGHRPFQNRPHSVHSDLFEAGRTPPTEFTNRSRNTATQQLNSMDSINH